MSIYFCLHFDEIRALKADAAEADAIRKQVAELTEALDREKEAASHAAGRAEEKLANELEKAQTRQEAAVLRAEKAGQDMLVKVREECLEAVSWAQAQAQAAIESAQAQATRYQKMYEELLAASEKPTRRTRRKASEETSETEKK